MKIVKSVQPGTEAKFIVSEDGNSWYLINELLPEKNFHDSIQLLEYIIDNPNQLSTYISTGNFETTNLDDMELTIPFQPLSYRDFMLYEKHCIDASRGFVKKYLPKLLPIVKIYEKITGKVFPKLKPKSRWYSHPIYYLGNHLTFITDGDPVSIPIYTNELDYELELGVILCKPLKNATAKEAEDAIGGFVVFNDFSARDVQISEMESGFGPMKSKNFVNSISKIIVTADEILPIIEDLKVQVKINNKSIIKTKTGKMDYSIPEAIAYASLEEQLYPGEFFGSGTIPGCTGIENEHLLNTGDTISLEIEKIGKLQNKIL